MFHLASVDFDLQQKGLPPPTRPTRITSTFLFSFFSSSSMCKSSFQEAHVWHLFISYLATTAKITSLELFSQGSMFLWNLRTFFFSPVPSPLFLVCLFCRWNLQINHLRGFFFLGALRMSTRPWVNRMWMWRVKCNTPRANFPSVVSTLAETNKMRPWWELEGRLPCGHESKRLHITRFAVFKLSFLTFLQRKLLKKTPLLWPVDRPIFQNKGWFSMVESPSHLAVDYGWWTHRLDKIIKNIEEFGWELGLWLATLWIVCHQVAFGSIAGDLSSPAGFKIPLVD